MSCIFGRKTPGPFFFFKRFFLFFNLDCQNLATLGFENCQISQNGKSLPEKKQLRVFLPQSNLFLATKNIYSRAALDFVKQLEIITFSQCKRLTFDLHIQKFHLTWNHQNIS